MKKVRLPDDDVMLVNCAGCGKELLGEKMRSFAYEKKLSQKYIRKDFADKRINGRPYCQICSFRIVKQLGL